MPDFWEHRAKLSPVRGADPQAQPGAHEVWSSQSLLPTSHPFWVGRGGSSGMPQSYILHFVTTFPSPLSVSLVSL